MAARTVRSSSRDIDAASHKRREKPLRLSPLAKRRKSGQQATTELRLKDVWTSGFHFNCMAFSIMMATKQIGASKAAQQETRQQSDEERRLTHEAILQQLPPEAAEHEGENGVWWCGQTVAKLTTIFEEQGFMSEAHVHGFANRLQRTIIVIDAREDALVITEYIPGYAVARQISMREARERRESEQQQPLWLLMSPSHWSALLPEA